MRKCILTALITSLVLGLGFNPLLAANARAQLDDQVEKVNHKAKKGGMDAALQRISTETGVPMDKIQAMHKRHGQQGPADLLLACVMADDTKKPADDFLKSHVNGKTWEAIARENKVPLERLTERLNRLETNLPDEKSDSADKDKNKQ